ncbi:Uma2 family endonuclease [Zavarzinella formosa]|uniref:Uma2 family endonuclease n=1 Tax=Zavarzinella formosa TaxID=360055 RepID=UPI00030284D5|nr:Uma2 family endonuclease [Zavarzinella formosa]
MMLKQEEMPGIDGVPPLRDGEQLNADEFHRRYEAMPHVRNAQLIKGIVRMSSPVRNNMHADPHFMMNGWLASYCFGLRGVRGKDNATLRVDDENEPQPDAMLLILPEFGGGTWSDDEDYIRGVPELVVEVAGSSTRLDAGEKRDLYQRIAVREYLLWRVEDNRVDWWILEDEVFQPLPADEAGVIRSRVFPGLWLDTPALLEGNTRLLSATLAAGLATPEYRAFAERFKGT